MAGSQFATPKPISASRFPRRFTLEQANRSLPLVKRVVSDIVHTHESIGGLQMKVAASTSTKEQKSFQKDLDLELSHLQDYVDELTDIGCELKDFQMGLVDFIGRHQGRDVCLCWKLGEEKIEYWHEFDSGFDSRQSISSLEE